MLRHPSLAVALPLIAVLSITLPACRVSSGSSASENRRAAKKWDFSTGPLGPLCKGCYYQEQIPAIGEDGTIYAAGARGVYALDPDGKQQWYFQNVSQPLGHPVHFVVVDDAQNVWFDAANGNSGTGSVIRVGPEGQNEGTMGLTGPVTQIGEAYDGSIVASGAALDIIGSTVRRRPWQIGGDFYSFIPDGGAYVTRGNLVALAPDHSVVWTKKIPAIGEPVLSADGTIYVGGNSALTAVNPDGTGKWSFSVPNHIVMSPSVANDGTIYFGCDDGNVYALAPDGLLKWRFLAGGAVVSTPAIAKNGTLYFGSLDTKLYAVGADGKLKWTFATAGQVFSPTIADDGTIYVQTGEGKLYAIQDSEDNGGLSGQWPKRGAGLRNTSRGVR